MITYDMIIEAQNYLVENWGEDGKKVIEATHIVTPYNKPFSIYVKHCTACGGNWGAMLLTGIEKYWPNVYDIIPDNLGLHPFVCICMVLRLCGVDTSE